MDIKEIIQLSGLSKVEFSRKFHIPYKVLLEWIVKERECPEELLKLLEYRVELIKWANDNNIQLSEEQNYKR